MLKSILSLLLAATTLFAVAQKETFHHATFTAPAGWTKEKTESSISFTKEDAKVGFCKLMIFKTVPGSGKVKADFDAAWDAMVKNPFKVQDAPQMRPVEKRDGWDVLMGSGGVEVEKEKAAIILITISSSEGMQNILILTNAPQYQAEIGTFLSSIEMKKVGTTASPITNGNARTPQLWMKSAVMGGNDFQEGYNLKFRHKWFAIYPNGDFYPYFPEEGFLGFDRPTNAESWGKATINGKKMTLEAKLWGRLKLDKISETQWNEEGSTIQKYAPCKSVDGLTLNGSYSPDGQDWQTKKPTPISGPITYITFKKDGSFVDYGCFNDSTAAKPAKGTYFIKNFTIVLQYENGFVKKRGFCSYGGADPVKVDIAYFIGPYPWFKGKS